MQAGDAEAQQVCACARFVEEVFPAAKGEFPAQLWDVFQVGCRLLDSIEYVSEVRHAAYSVYLYFSVFYQLMCRFTEK